ncbi:glycoside hydrolase family protein [Paramyrothecium foliicola]|nr:glycoside hydrolase family protein [Paramyrothecium foliicola]
MAAYFGLFLLSGTALATSRGLAKPQMGWNSWNTYKANINSSLIEATAEAIKSKGLADVGYEYVILDAGWQSKTRAEDGRQQPNATLFPNGISGVADKVHGLGLKIGIYSDAGIYDCDFKPGSWGYEELDAVTYASWGVDYLKYDNCGGFHAGTVPQQDRFAIMSSALKRTGRDIFYSLCQWGHQFPWFWADQISDSYRMSGDIYANFSSDRSGVCKTAYCMNTGYAGVSVLTMIRKMREISMFQKRGSWADMDMMEIGTNTMTELEEQTHMSFWSALKSPLIIGCNVINISDSSLAIYKNRELIAVNQDDLGRAVDYVPSISTENSIQIWGGPLSSGKNVYVILALNYGKAETDIEIPFGQLPNFPSRGTRGYKARDIWAAKDLGTIHGALSFSGVKVYETKVIVLS